MKNFVVIGVFMMMVSRGFCNSLSFEFTKISDDGNTFYSAILNIDAEMNQRKDIQIIFKPWYGPTFDLEMSPFLEKSNLKSVSSYHDYFPRILRGKTETDFTFAFNKIPKDTSSMNPCARIEGTSDYLCRFIIRITGYGTTEDLQTTPLSLRVSNYSGGSPSVQMFGGDYQMSTSISQLGTKDTEKIDLGLYFKDTEIGARERTLLVNNSDTDFLSQTRPVYLYFTCTDGLKMLVNFTSNKDLAQGQMTANLAQLGLPFDKERNCSFAVIFNNPSCDKCLVPMKSSRPFSIGPGEVKKDKIQVILDKVSGIEGRLDKYDEQMKSLENLKKLEQLEKLGKIEEQMVKIESRIERLGRLEDMMKEIQEALGIYSSGYGRELAKKSVRSLLGKAASAVVGRA